MLLSDAIKITENVAENLKSVPGTIGEKLVTKLEKNKNICMVLRRVPVDNLDESW